MSSTTMSTVGIDDPVLELSLGRSSHTQFALRVPSPSSFTMRFAPRSFRSQTFWNKWNSGAVGSLLARNPNSLSTKYQVHFVLLKHAIGREQRHLFGECLGDEHPVKRVTMMTRQRIHCQCVKMSNIQGLQGHDSHRVRHKFRRPPRQNQFSVPALMMNSHELTADRYSSDALSASISRARWLSLGREIKLWIRTLVSTRYFIISFFSGVADLQTDPKCRLAMARQSHRQS